MCQHLQFSCESKITRLTKSEEDLTIIGYRADIEITCLDCHKPFKVIGLPTGYHDDKPTISFDGVELRVPIEPII